MKVTSKIVSSNCNFILLDTSIYLKNSWPEQGEELVARNLFFFSSYNL